MRQVSKVFGVTELVTSILLFVAGAAQAQPVLDYITVAPASVQIQIGGTDNFTAVGHFSDGSTRNMTQSVGWSSSDASIATVNDVPGTRGLATGVSAGQVTVTATDLTSGVFGEAALKVVGTLTKLRLTPRQPKIAQGDTENFTTTGILSDGSTINMTQRVEYSSDNEAVATVTNTPGNRGLATGVSPGFARIDARDPATGVRASDSDGDVRLEVLGRLVSVFVKPSRYSLSAGSTRYFTAVGRLSDGSKINLTQRANWSSSDETVAVVSNADGNRGLATGIARGTAMISALDPRTGISSSDTGEDGELEVTGILSELLLTPRVKELAVGHTRHLTCRGILSDGATRNMTRKVTYRSSDETVAIVSNAERSWGLVTAVGPGEATIDAHHDLTGVDSQDTSGGARIIVEGALTSLEVKPNPVALAVGGTRHLTTRGVLSTGRTVNLTQTADYSSADESIATVSNTPGNKGLVTAVAPGSTTVTATDPGSGLSADTTVNVKGALVGISLKPSSVFLVQGASRHLTAIGSFSDGSTSNYTQRVIYSSSDEAVATVTNTDGNRGLVEAVGAGDAQISAQDPVTSITAPAINVHVAGVLQSIRLQPASKFLKLGGTENLTAIGSFSDGSESNLTQKVEYESSDQAVATVTNTEGHKGLVTAVGLGSAVITARDATSGISSHDSGQDTLITVIP